MQGIYALHKRSTLILQSKLLDDQVNVYAGTKYNRIGVSPYSGMVEAQHWEHCASTACCVCRAAAAVLIKRRGK